MFFFTICAESFAEFQPSSTLNISCYQLCSAAAVERFLSSECIPAECLCLVCRHAACLIYAIMSELLLWFPLDSVCHSHTSCDVSAPINQVNISALITSVLQYRAAQFLGQIRNFTIFCRFKAKRWSLLSQKYGLAYHKKHF